METTKFITLVQEEAGTEAQCGCVVSTTEITLPGFNSIGRSLRFHFSPLAAFCPLRLWGCKRIKVWSGRSRKKKSSKKQKPVLTPNRWAGLENGKKKETRTRQRERKENAHGTVMSQGAECDLGRQHRTGTAGSQKPSRKSGDGWWLGWETTKRSLRKAEGHSNSCKSGS